MGRMGCDHRIIIASRPEWMTVVMTSESYAMMGRGGGDATRDDAG